MGKEGSALAGRFAGEVHGETVVWYLRGGVAAPLLLATVILVAGLLTPGYNPLSETVSRLAIDGRPYSVLVNAGFVAYGILINGFAYGLYQRIKFYLYARFVWLLLAMYGIGMLLIGIFHDTSKGPGTSINPGTALHGVFSLTAVLALVSGIAAFSVLTYKTPAWRGFCRLSRAIILLILLLSLVSHTDALKVTEGLWQRLTHLVLLTWVEFAALRALRQYQS
ncbi:MAG: DUF998 domain-containing protein [Chloroflexi bacterium]|nr:DUF998 domain-containing protein [Chloroflexota bacterium]